MELYWELLTPILMDIEVFGDLLSTHGSAFCSSKQHTTDCSGKLALQQRQHLPNDKRNWNNRNETRTCFLVYLNKIAGELQRIQMVFAHMTINNLILLL